MISKRKSTTFLALGGLGLLIFTTMGAEAFGQAVSNSNQIAGVVEFTNANPAILDILSPTGGNKGFTYAYIRADSIGVSPTLNNYTYPQADSATRTNYEITVESSASGIPYRVQAEINLNSNSSRYRFGFIKSAPVYPEPAANVSLNFSQCAGLLNIKFVNTEGAPLSVNGGYIIAYKESSPGSNHYSYQAQNFRIPNGASQEYLAVEGDGSRYRVDVIFEAGNDPYSSQVRSLCQHYVTVGCDEIIEVVCVISPGENLGEIIGNIDMIGEDEHQQNSLTRIRAFDGPLKNFRYQRILATPSQGPFTLKNLVPSAADSPARGYTVYGEMTFRTGYRAEYFRTPWLHSSYNGRVYVNAGQSTDLGDTFVMNPGYVVGDILLAGPPSETTGSCLEDIARDEDYSGDGLPEAITISSSSVAASGTNKLADGATMKSWGGTARAIFTGSFNEETDNFEGDYELALGGLKGEPSIWRPDTLILSFRDSDTPEGPPTYQYSWYRITNNNIGDRTIVPGQTIEIDHAYCMSEIHISYKSLSGILYRPNATGYGRFVGSDFQEASANYSVSISYANGTPTSLSSASDQGLVTLTLPQGSYTLTPKINAVNPSGGISYTELPPITIEVGCNQSMKMTTELQISLNDLPGESAEETIDISGTINSSGKVTEIAHTLNEGPETRVCRDCGEDPKFSFELTLEEGENKLTVQATDESGSEASVTAYINYSAPPAENDFEEMTIIDTDSDTLDFCDEEPFLTISLVSGAVKQYSWQHGFLPGADALSHPEVSPDQGHGWFSYTSPNLMAMTPGRNCKTRTEGATPEHIVGLWVGGNGWDFQGRADNIVLSGVNNGTTISNLIQNGTFDDNFSEWEKSSSKRPENPSKFFWTIDPDDGLEAPSFSFRRTEAINDGGSVGLFQQLNQSVIGWDVLQVSYNAKIISNTLQDSGWYWTSYGGWGETPCRIVIQYLVNTGCE
ncbi:MAG: hypothetical protein GY841_17270, partial [FCB group bacterium]|nr:hypothetical protein [FCB group bacterium]